MTPVMLLTDGYIANAAEPWLVPDPESLRTPFPVKPSSTDDERCEPACFLPYKPR